MRFPNSFVFVGAALAGAVLVLACGEDHPLDIDGGAPGAGGIGGNLSSAGPGVGGAAVPAPGAGVTVAAPPKGARYGYFYGNSGKVFAVPEGGGAPVVLATSPDGRGLGRAVVFDDANVYSSNEPNYTGGSPPEGMTSILALPIAGGPARTLASGLFLVTELAVDAQNVYFVDEAMGIGAVSKSGGEVRHLRDDPGGITHLAAVGGNLYWTSGGAVWRMPIVSGDAEMLTSYVEGANAIAADSSGVYWLHAGLPSVDVECGPSDYSVRFLAAGATVPTTLAQHLVGAVFIALGGGVIYWIGDGDVCNPFPDGPSGIQAISPGDAAPRLVEGGLIGPGNLYVGGSTLYFTTVTDPNEFTLAPNAVPL